jgi:hypothetical protein
VKHILKLDAQLKDELWRHLLPDDADREQAAFLYTTPTTVGDDVVFDVVAHELLEHSDFAMQESHYLELSDQTRLRIIKRAHALDASVVELHSHPWHWPAEFSLSDRSGLEEAVPHMRWRLKNRPYLAVVVALTSYDSLAWAGDSDKPAPLILEIDGDQLIPTGRSLGGWHGRR